MNVPLVRRLASFFPARYARRLPQVIRVVEVSSQVSRKWNSQYRRNPRPANVLSFRYDDTYGEILICPVLIREQAREQDHSYGYQMTEMILHGMLHLAGVHHEKSVLLGKRFLKLERRILEKFVR